MKRFVLQRMHPGSDEWIVLDTNRPIGQRTVFCGSHEDAETKAAELEAAAASGTEQGVPK